MFKIRERQTTLIGEAVMSLRVKREVEYLVVREHGQGFSIIAQPHHSGSMIEFFRSRDVAVNPVFQVIGIEDALEFGKEENFDRLAQILEGWKAHYIAFQDQKNELAQLKNRLDDEKTENKRRVLRKHIRRLVLELKGKIRPWDYFSEDELREMDEKAADDAACDEA